MKKAIAILWIGFTVVANTLAVSGLLYHAGLANTVWRGPFAALGQSYLEFIDRSFAPLDTFTNALLGWVAPFWVLHLIVAYLLIASAIMVWGWIQQKPKNLISRLKSAGPALAWIAILPRSVIRSLRGQIKGRAAIGYALAILATYGVSRSFNADIELSNNAVETVYLGDTCAATLNKFHRARPFLQDNFDKAVASQNWARAERLAGSMSNLTYCLGDKGQKTNIARQYLNIDATFYDIEQVDVDLAHMHLEMGDAFYDGEQWQAAQTHYWNGLAAFDRVVAVRTAGADTSTYSPSNEAFQTRAIPVTQKDIDLAVLFNLEALYRQRVQLLGATRYVLDDENAKNFGLNEIDFAIFTWDRLRFDFYSIASEDTEVELADQIREHGLASIPNLISDLIETAKSESGPGQQIRAAHLLRQLIGQHESAYSFKSPGSYFGGDVPSELADQWLQAGDAIHAAYLKQAEQGETRIAPLQLMITSILNQKIVGPAARNAAYSQSPLTDEDKNKLREYWDYASRFIKTYEDTRPELRAAILAPTVIKDPYPNIIMISNALGEKDAAYTARQKQLNHLFDAAIASSDETTFFSAIQSRRLTHLTTKVLAKDQEIERSDIYDILSDASLPDTHAVKKRWIELTDRLCLNLKRQNWNIGDQSCPDYLRDLIFQSPGPAYGATEPQRSVESPVADVSFTVDIDLLFGTTRAYNPDSKIAEKTFTRKDEPNGYGRRGSVTLTAPLEELGPPLLANALVKGEERADIFKFVGMPEIYGYGPEAEARFREELVKRLERANHGESLIFVHGVANTFSSAAKRTAQLSYDLSFPGASMFYTWPTESNFLGYFKDVDVPQMAIDDLASFIDDASNSSTKVHIIAHSHGARVTVDALKKLVKDNKASGKQLNLGQVILAAPDVSGKKLKKAVDKYLSPVSDRVTVYTNSSDGALWASSLLRLFKWRGGLGKSGDTCAAQLIDASSAVPFGSHGYFAKESEVLADLRTLIWHRGIAPAQRCYLQAKSENSRASWKFSKKSCDITAYDLASQISIKGQQVASVDFDLIYADLVKKNNIETAEAQDGEFNPDDWKIINPSDGTIGSAEPVVVARQRYDAAVNVHNTLQAAGASTATAGCAP